MLVNSIMHTTDVEYHTDIKFNSTEFKQLDYSHGPFTTELFASADNNLLENFYTKEQNSFSVPWTTGCPRLYSVP